MAEPLTEDQYSFLIRGILKGLAYLHDEKNIIHRDVKPDNVMLKKCQVKLIDFGLSVKANSAQDFPKCGTLLYTPPE